MVESLFVILYVAMFAEKKTDEIVSYLGEVNIVEQQWEMLKKETYIYLIKKKTNRKSWSQKSKKNVMVFYRVTCDF